MRECKFQPKSTHLGLDRAPDHLLLLLLIDPLLLLLLLLLLMLMLSIQNYDELIDRSTIDHSTAAANAVSKAEKE